MSSKTVPLSVEIWTNIISLIPSITDVKNISLVNSYFRDECRSLLWHTINLCRTPRECMWSDTLEKLLKCLRIFDSNQLIELNVKKIIFPSEYPRRSLLVHMDTAIQIALRCKRLTHVVIARPRQVTFNMDNAGGHPQPIGIHVLEYCSFFNVDMALSFPAGVTRLDGIFPMRDSANAFVSTQFETLRTWNGLQDQDHPYFMELQSPPPPLTSISIANMRHYSKFSDSIVIQESLRALKIGGHTQTGFTFNAAIFFPTMRSFQSLDSLAINLPWERADAYLEELVDALPDLHRLSLSSNRVINYDLIPAMLALEGLTLWMVAYIRQSNQSDDLESITGITDSSIPDHGVNLNSLQQRCPRLASIEIPDYSIRSNTRSPYVLTETPREGRRVRLWAGGFEEIMGLPASTDLRDGWMY